ncbi:MAG TPA: glycosyltransferase family 2 protein [Caulifigura sp.]|nr:glycosyltransferase family 2 protein [Caulifigura sp.]
MTVLVFGGLTAIAVWQVLPALWRVRRADVRRAIDTPRAQVILSLKGLDPFLERCLDRLASQDYPNYQVTVVVDSQEDPAWDQALAAQRSFGSSLIDLKVRTHRSQHCTRKLSNLLTAIESLPAGIEIIALCDGDAVVHESWLSELVGGLEDNELAAVGANRWYAPTTFDLATLSRHYWNALAVPNTHQHAILWAGSLAIRRSIVDEPDFRAAFARGFADDTVIARYLHDTGRKSRLLGGTYVVNSETTSIAGYWNFLVRQMLCVRIHHPRWTPIFIHSLVLAFSTALLAAAAVSGGWTAFAIGLTCEVLYGLVLICLLSLYDLKLRRTYSERQSLQVPVSRRRVLMTVPALLFTSVVYPAATITAAWTRKHVWRGVEYHLERGRVITAIDLDEHAAIPAPVESAITTAASDAA